MFVLLALAMNAVAATGPLQTHTPDTGTHGQLLPLSAPYMTRGYFHAASPILDDNALGGFASSDNYPRALDLQVPSDQVILLAIPDEIVPFYGNLGFRVLLINSTGLSMPLDASDSRLHILREALDVDGEWKSIEYFPQSWCGNSYHRVTLPSNHYWSFAAPVYSGTDSVQMRFVLDRGESIAPIYSNTFAGSIQREQFHNKQGHAPESIIDPYDE